MTKLRVETDTSRTSQIEVALACDPGTSKGGLYGLTDVFSIASEFAAKRQDLATHPPVRITHWLADEDSDSVRCCFDSFPGTPHVPTVVVIPNNIRATVEPDRERQLVIWLRSKHAEGVVLAAVCGGVFILAKTGLLCGRQATTHWSFTGQFAARFPDVMMDSDQMIIDYGDVVTAGGALAWADLGLHLTERFLGPAVMVDTARYLNVDPPGREQRFYSGFEPRTKHGDAPILAAQDWISTMRERLVTTTEIAGHVGLEPRTFLRRFVRATGMKPSEYQQRIRMVRARELLEFSRKSVEEVAAAIGYADVGGFRKAFFKIIGLTPSEYKSRFARRSGR